MSVLGWRWRWRWDFRFTAADPRLKFLLQVMELPGSFAPISVLQGIYDGAEGFKPPWEMVVRKALEAGWGSQ